jgi:hypothetical protein
MNHVSTNVLISFTMWAVLETGCAIKVLNRNTKAMVTFTQ